MVTTDIPASATHLTYVSDRLPTIALVVKKKLKMPSELGIFCQNHVSIER